MIIAKGAEALISREKNILIKERIKKSYRIPEIDVKLRSQRTKFEVNALRKAGRMGVNVPEVIEISNNKIRMQYLEGETLRDLISGMTVSERKKAFNSLGNQIARMHNNGLIHGDLTTSNFIMKNNEVFIIDFGLSTNSLRIEDLASDIHLLKQALISKHLGVWEECFNSFMKSYLKEIKRPEEILNRINVIQKRGRYIKREKI